MLTHTHPFAALLFISTTALAGSLQEPHVFPKRGPFFEGWYTRVQDIDSDRSFAVVVARILGQSAIARPAMSGYAALLHRAPERPNLIVTESFPSWTTSTPHMWSDEHDNWFDGDALSLEFADGPKVTLTPLGARRPWDRRGPAGLASYFAFIPLHWYVDSTATSVQWSYRASADSDEVSGLGITHFEKNWGQAFPNAWIWGQAVHKTQDVQIAFAGGPAPGIPNHLAPDVHMVGVRMGPSFWAFRPQDPGTLITVERRPCEGFLRVLARQPQRSVEIIGKATRSSFSELATPTKDGFVPGADESFDTTYTVRIYEHTAIMGLTGLGVLKRQFVLQGGALEFGGTYRCQSPLPIRGYQKP